MHSTLLLTYAQIATTSEEARPYGGCFADVPKKLARLVSLCDVTAFVNLFGQLLWTNLHSEDRYLRSDLRQTSSTMIYRATPITSTSLLVRLAGSWRLMIKTSMNLGKTILCHTIRLVSLPGTDARPFGYWIPRV